MARSQREISSGKRIQSATDAPDQIGNLLSARATLARITQVQQNLGLVKSEVNTAEQAISKAVSVMERARVLAAQAASDTQNATTRLGIAEEVRNLMQQLVGLANTSLNNRYIFSGDTDQTTPFAYLPGPPPGVSTYAGAATTREVEDVSGNGISLARDGGTIFRNPDPTRDAFGTLSAFYTALTTNDLTGIRDQLANLGTAGVHMNQVLAFYGSTQNRVASALSLANSQEISARAEISGIEDADAAQAILELNRATIDQQASLSARARLPRTSLFDFLG